MAFNTPVKSMKFSVDGRYLAVSKSRNLLCRNRCVGSACIFHRFAWSGEEEWIIVALDVEICLCVFDVEGTDVAWPKRAVPILTLAPTFGPTSLTVLYCSLRRLCDADDDDFTIVGIFVWNLVQ